MVSTPSTIVPLKPKQRCWSFHVMGATCNDVNDDDLLSSFRERYSTVKRLEVNPISDCAGHRVGIDASTSTMTTASTPTLRPPATTLRDILVEVQFTGPQPSEGPSALLCALLCAAFVEATPVELLRGRRKRARMPDGSASGATRIGSGSGGAKITATGSRRNTLAAFSEDKDEGGRETVGGDHRRAATTLKPALMTVGLFPTVNTKCEIKDEELGTLRRDASGVACGGPLAPSVNLGLRLPPGAPEISSCSAATSVSGACCPAAPTDGRIRGTASYSGGHLEESTVETKVEVQVVADEGEGPLSESKDSSILSLGGTAPRAGVIGRIPGDGSCGDADIHNVEPRFEPLALSPVIVGGHNWDSNQSGTVPVDTPLSPQTVEPTLSGWSLDPIPIDCCGDMLGSDCSTVMDMSDVDFLFGEMMGEGSTAAASKGPDRGGETLLLDTQGRERQQPRSAPSSSECMPNERVPTVKFTAELPQTVIDFEGHPAVFTTTVASLQSPEATPSDSQGRLVFTGLGRICPNFRNLTATIRFAVNSEHTARTEAGPVKDGGDGCPSVRVTYPSMHELWPDLYNTVHIQVVEVDVVVELKSGSGVFEYVGPELKMTYVRAQDATVKESRNQDSDHSSTMEMPTFPMTNPEFGSMGSSPPYVSYSCVDRSTCCGDWIETIRRSVFGTSSTVHHRRRAHSDDF